MINVQINVIRSSNNNANCTYIYYFFNFVLLNTVNDVPKTSSLEFIPSNFVTEQLVLIIFCIKYFLIVLNYNK